MLFNIEEISSAIQKGMAEYEKNLDFEETGHVLSVKDGVVLAYGLNKVKSGELVEFDNNITGMVLNLYFQSVGIVLFAGEKNVKEGEVVRRTGRFVTIPVGEELLGRVINPLGEPLDGLPKLNTKESLPIERDAPSIIDRKSVHESMHTGIKTIDGLIPIGRGQRQLIVGDRQTGKTTIAIDAIISQLQNNNGNNENKKLYCIYVAIGQKASTVAKIIDTLRIADALKYTVVVVATASDTAAMQYIVPYAACSIGEYFRDNGKHALIVYDDLSKHAIAYRQMSLLLRRPPGREAYPGDIFFVHSRLLERAAKLSEDMGSGSLTALPIVETQAGDISAYIPTNLISITDGQIFLESELFNKGIRPAINIGMSVSRVGSAAQTKAMKKVAGTIKLELAQAREMEAFAQFASDLDIQTKNLLKRGSCLTEILKQDKHSPVELGKQIAIIFAAVNGYLDKLNIASIEGFEMSLVDTISANFPKIFEEINNTGELSDNTKTLLHKISQDILLLYNNGK